MHELGHEWKKFLADVDPSVAFRYKGKGTVKNIFELADAIKNSSASEFAAHSNEKGNDFANWVNDVLGDSFLASQLRLSSEKHSTLVLIERRIKEATAHVQHTQAPMSKKTEKVAPVVDHIGQLEQDLKHVLGHDTKSAIYKYKADHKMNLWPEKNHLKELFWGLAVGLIFGILIGRISGIF